MNLIIIILSWKGAVKEMDNFMDRLAQKFNAQDTNKANSEAETNEMRKTRSHVAEYEKILQDMRKLNYKNSELSEKLDLMIGENADKIQNISQSEYKLLEVLREITDEQSRNIETQQQVIRDLSLVGNQPAPAPAPQTIDEEMVSELVRKMAGEMSQRLSGNLREGLTERLTEGLNESLDEKFKNSEEFNHKENVKVYRNVQAVVVDELKRYDEKRQQDDDAVQKRLGAVTCISAIAAVASICNIIIWVLVILINSGIIG